MLRHRLLVAAAMLLSFVAVGALVMALQSAASGTSNHDDECESTTTHPWGDELRVQCTPGSTTTTSTPPATTSTTSSTTLPCSSNLTQSGHPCATTTTRLLCYEGCSPTTTTRPTIVIDDPPVVLGFDRVAHPIVTVPRFAG